MARLPRKRTFNKKPIVLCEGRLNLLGEIRPFSGSSLFPNNVRGEKGLFMVCKYVYNIDGKARETRSRSFLKYNVGLQSGVWPSRAGGRRKKKKSCDFNLTCHPIFFFNIIENFIMIYILFLSCAS